MKLQHFIVILLTVLFISGYAQAHKHGDGQPHDDEVIIEKLADQIFMVQAGGGNIAVSIGEQGVFMIDNGLSEKSDQVMEAVASLSDKPVKMLVNTHWHFDHAGNNDYFGSDQTTIIAHDNVRARLKQGGTIKAFNKVVEPAAINALPILTYDKDVTVHLNGKEIDVIALEPAHTDGDSIIYWQNENILHAGDVFFNGFYPFIDASSGGSLRGMLKASDKIQTIINENTKIIPGHGPMATKADFDVYHDFLKTLADRITTSRAQGMSKEDWVEKNPLADFDEKWGDGFLDLSTFTALIWEAY